MKLKVLLTILILISIGICPSWAQEVLVRGRVLDEKQLPLPGANILVKGTTIGTVTDIDGEFSINVPNSSSLLVISFLGYLKQEVMIGTQSTIEVTLRTDLSDLSEVVVVGYGDQRKINMTGSVETIDGAAIARQPVFQASQALVGMTPGLTAIQSSSQPGADNATLRIRGTGSLGASNDPLVLVDGIQGDIDNIDPADIESISVLKDAAAAAIYG
jgi:outer membrane receptor protein involved in Fe transport